jgi:hypothetical protein
MALGIAAQGSAWATRYFDIYNNSSNYAIVAMWVSPHAQRQWGDQVLSSPIYPETSHHISWNRTQPWEWYDLKLRFANGYTAFWTEPSHQPASRKQRIVGSPLASTTASIRATLSVTGAFGWGQCGTRPTSFSLCPRGHQ